MVSIKVAFQPNHEETTVPIGTPTTFARVKPPNTNEMASPRFFAGMVSLATIMAREISTPVTIAVKIRNVSSIAYDVDMAHKALNKMKATIKASIHLRFGKWLVADITKGVAMANVIANAETSVPAFALDNVRLEEISVKIPTITNSLVPRTKVNKLSVKISSQCCLVNVSECINISHFFA